MIDFVICFNITVNFYFPGVVINIIALTNMLNFDNDTHQTVSMLLEEIKEVNFTCLMLL